MIKIFLFDSQPVYLPLRPEELLLPDDDDDELRPLE